jgi:hypothetical protein
MPRIAPVTASNTHTRVFPFRRRATATIDGSGASSARDRRVLDEDRVVRAPSFAVGRPLKVSEIVSIPSTWVAVNRDDDGLAGLCRRR